MSSNQVTCEYTAQDGGAKRQLTEDFIGGEGKMKEEDDFEFVFDGGKVDRLAS